MRWGWNKGGDYGCWVARRKGVEEGNTYDGPKGGPALRACNNRNGPVKKEEEKGGRSDCGRPYAPIVGKRFVGKKGSWKDRARGPGGGVVWTGRWVGGGQCTGGGNNKVTLNGKEPHSQELRRRWPERGKGVGQVVAPDLGA